MLGVAQPGIASQSRFAARESLSRPLACLMRCSEGRHPLPSLTLARVRFPNGGHRRAPIRDGTALVCARDDAVRARDEVWGARLDSTRLDSTTSRT